MSNLYLKICEEEERVINLRSKDLFCPPLKQIGNSLYEIKMHYMTNDSINVVPFKCPPWLAEIRATLLNHLGVESFLHSNNILTGSTIEWTTDQERCSPSLVVLMESLALAMDFGISPKPRDVQCDILIAIFGQPVIVLTLVDGDKTCRNVRRYNASVARGVTSTIRKFMDESLNIVSGVMHKQDMDTMDTFEASITTIAKNSRLFVTTSSLTTNQTRYEKIVTAFWAGVAETRSVISSDGRVDTDYLRFLTKDQCIILMENINSREVEVQFHPGTGATTLMVEVARRLLKLDHTLLVCSSQEERERLRSVYPDTEIADDLTESDLSNYTNVVGVTGDKGGHVSGRLWSFRKADTKTEQLQQDVGMIMIEKENPSTEIHISSGAEKGDLEHLSMEFKTLKMSNVNIQGHLLRKIIAREEWMFDLRSKDLYRPPLKQIGNSICDIKAHYMSNGPISIVPTECPPRLARIRATLLNHLREDCFLYKYNIVTGSTIDQTAEQERRSPRIVALMDSLALAMDFEISHYTSEVQCDSLLAIFGQPVIVLTLVDGDKKCRNVRRYNASVARGVTSTLRKFMDESLNIVSGVIHLQDMDTMDTFEASITTIAKNSGLFVTPSSLTTNPTRYEKIVTAFWAGVAETRSVISSGGRVNTDYLRFLTRDQCIILMENINNREVEVQFQPGTGATTLMVETARRLAKVDTTLLVCRSNEDKERLKALFPNTKTASDLRSCDLLKLTNVVNETTIPLTQTGGRIWTFTKDHSPVGELQQDVDAFQNLVDRTQKLIYLLSDGDRREKMKYLSGQFETLKFLDITIRWLMLLNSLSNSVAFEYRPVYRYSPGGDRNQRLETIDYVHHVVEQLKHGLEKRRDLFPLLGDVIKQVMFPVPCLKAESESQLDATSERPLAFDSKKSEADTTVDQDLRLGVWEPVKQRGGMHDTTGTKTPDMQLEADTRSKVPDSEKITPIPKFLIAKNRKDEILKRIDAKENWIEIVHDLSRGGAGTRITDVAAAGITVDQGKPTDGHLDQVVEEGQEHKTTHETTPRVVMADTCHVEDANTTGELRGRLKELEKEASRQKKKVRDLTDAIDHLVDWEYNMECLSQQMATIGIQDVITDIIGEDEIPVSGKQPRSASFGGDRLTRRRPKRPCLLYQLRGIEYGAQKQKDLLNVVSGVITDEQRRLSYLLIHLDRLNRGPPMTFNRERVDRKLAVSGDGMELVNWRGWSDDQRTDRFKLNEGTSSRLPISFPPSPSALTVATYWETHTRLQVKKNVSGWLLEMAVVGEGEVDTRYLVSLKDRSSWGLRVGDCPKHQGHICTTVWENKRQAGTFVTDEQPGHVCTELSENWRQVGECQTDTMSPTAGTDVTLKYGITLDVGRGRLAFIDVNRGRVLHKFDVNFHESLFPMFNVRPLPDSVHATMRLISKREVAMTGEKQKLIAQALFCK